MSRLDEIEALLAETTGWLEWISPKATTEIAVVFPDGSVYLPTGGTEEEFAFSNAQGKVRRLVRAEDVAPLVAMARAVEAVADRIEPHANNLAARGDIETSVPLQNAVKAIRDALDQIGGAS